MENDADLYGVETKLITEAVKRNIERFPEEFRFQVTKEEYDFLRSQFATLKNSQEQVETRGGRQYLPYVFYVSEHVLKTDDKADTLD